MPPYTPNSSMAQQRLMFAKARRGEVSMEDAEGRARASEGKQLPEYVGRKKKRSAKGRSRRR